MMNRLVHHAEVISLKGDSYRLKDRDLGRVRAAGLLLVTISEARSLRKDTSWQIRFAASGLADRLHPICVSSDPQGGGDGTSALKTPHEVKAELFDLADHVRVPIRIQRES